MRKSIALLTTIATLSLSGCGYNTMQAQDEGVKAKWSEVVNQYQRRADLIPNIVKTVQAEANFERSTLNEVIKARASATSIQATPELINDPAAFQKFTEAQNQLQGSLSRLMLVAENYPNLKSNAGFQDIRAQLEGTENRVTVARKNYIDAVQSYNVTLRTFPNNLTAKVMGYEPKANYTVSNEAQISTSPTVDFGNEPKK